jgi:predicted permease
MNSSFQIMPAFESMWREFAQAGRRLARTPVFTIAALATLTIGIGFTDGLFIFARAVLLRPLPYPEPHRLVRVFETDPRRDWTRHLVAPANLTDWRRRNTVFTEIAAYDGVDDRNRSRLDVYLTGLGEPRRLKALSVSANLFRVLGVMPLAGRGFQEAEDYESERRVVILSHGLWQLLFAGDRGAIGRTIELNGRGHEIVGIMPAGFAFPGRDVQVWLPFNYQPQVFLEARYHHWLNVVARLKAGASSAGAGDEMTRIAAQLAREYPDTNATAGVRLEPLHHSFSREWQRPLVLLLAAVSLLLLVICLNLAGLQMARGLGRAREVAIRGALGASRVRLVGHMAADAALLALVGGALGLWVASLMRASVVRSFPEILPVFADARLDYAVWLVSLLLPAMALAISGVLPAILTTRPGILADRSGSGSGVRPVASQVLVGCQVAIAVVLIAAAGLLARTLWNLEHVDRGFEADSTLAFSIALPGSRYPDSRSVLRAVEAIEAGLRRIPLVDRVGASSTLPLRGSETRGGARRSEAVIEGRARDDHERELLHESITPDYFHATGGLLLRGRFFDDRDRPPRPPVVIVNQTLATRYFGGSDPLGRRMSFEAPKDEPRWVTIVGVIADEKQSALQAEALPKAYTPLAHHIEPRLSFVVRSRTPPDAVLAEARQRVRHVDRDLVITDVTTLRGLVDADLADYRLRANLVIGFSATALLLIAVGLYGMLSVFVTQHSRDIGVRAALGATRWQLIRIVLARGMTPAWIGMIAGVGAAYVCAGFVEALLFGIDAHDWRTVVMAAGLACVTSLAGCVMPAWRATRQDPLVVLRTD